MKRAVAAALLGALLVWSLVTWGAGGSASIAELRGPTMGTTYSVLWVGAPRSAVEPAVAAVLTETVAQFSTYDAKSEISRCNAYRGSAPFAVSHAFAALAARALDLAAATGGAFDPTVAPISAVWGFKRQSAPVPSDADIDAARARVGYRRVQVVGDSIVKAMPELELDFDAIAPGYAVDRITAALMALGVDAAMVEIGGEVRCFGAKPDGSAWQIGVEQPPVADEMATELEEVLAVRDAAIATSGSYRNYRATNDRRVHHIFDPRTGRNADNAVVSVTVRATTCELADGLATALMVLGADDAAAVMDRLGDPQLGALFLLRAADGGIVPRHVRW